jgi:UDP-N-acetylglucosamine 2-epimerase (non-hydrolysing)
MKIAIVFGTRPEIIRLSCVIERLDPLCELHLVHTGQNFERLLSDVFFEELDVRAPDRHFSITGGSFAERVGAILPQAQRTFEEEQPDRLLVLGDTDSAMSAYVAKRMGIPVFHMEAGNRCFDDRVPEEVNRRLIDQCSDLLMPYTERSRENLLREGFPGNRVLVIGNPIKEVLDRHETEIAAAAAAAELGVDAGRYLLLTLHRQETVDHPQRLQAMLAEIGRAAEDLELSVVFSVHPRTRERLNTFGLTPAGEPWKLSEPFGYFDFVSLIRDATCVLTDSGTVQEECCILGVPTVTVRDATERPETLECGSNALSGVDTGALGRLITASCEGPRDFSPPPEYLRPDVSATVAKLVLGQIPGAAPAL